MRRKMKTGKPTAAIVCVMAKVAAKPNNSTPTKIQIAARRLIVFSSAVAGVRALSRARKTILAVIPFPSRAWIPITKKRPARTP